MRYLLCIVFSLTSFCLSAQNVADIVIQERFDDQPLNKVIRLLKNKYKIKLAYDDALLTGQTITGNFDNVSLQKFLETTLFEKGIDYQLLNGKVILLPRRLELDPLIPTLFNFTAHGQVFDEATREALPFAVVRVAGKTTGTVTNKDGYFVLPNVPSDTSTIEVSYLGYKKNDIKLAPGASREPLQVSMNESTQSLGTVSVEDVRANETVQLGEEIGQIAINPKQISSVPSLGELDIFRSLQLLPGISGTNESSGNFSIRGSAPSQNLVTFDGITLYQLDHFFGVFSAINPDVVKDVQVYKSGFSPKYGGRVAGVVDITGKSGNRLKPAFSLGSNLLSLRATAEVPILNGKGAIIVAGRRAYTDIIRSDLFEKLFDRAKQDAIQLSDFVNENEDLNPDFHFYDFHAKATAQLSPKDMLSLSLYRGKDQLAIEDSRSIDRPGNVVQRDIFDESNNWGNNGISISLSRQWNSSQYSRLIFGESNYFQSVFSSYRFERDSTGLNERFTLDYSSDINLKDTQLALENEWVIDPRHTLDFGFNFNSISITYQESFDNQVLPREENDTGNIFAIYLNDQFKITDRFTGQLGFRASFTDVTAANYFSPRLSLSYKLADPFRIKVALGRYQQLIQQQVTVDPLTPNSNFWFLADDEFLGPLVSTNFAAGFNFKKHSWNVDLEFFHKTTDNVFRSAVSHEIDRQGRNPFPAEALGTNYVNGVDLMIQKEWNNYSGWLSYTLMESYNRFDEIDNGAAIPSSEDQRHEFKLVNMLRLDHWNLSATWIYGSGKAILQPNIALIRDNQRRIRRVILDSNDPIINRLPAYHRLDLSAAYKFGQNNFKGEFGLSLLNLYGRENVRNQRLDIRSVQGAIGEREPPNPFYTNISLLDFTPTFFLNISF